MVLNFCVLPNNASTYILLFIIFYQRPPAMLVNKLDYCAPNIKLLCHQLSYACPQTGIARKVVAELDLPLLLKLHFIPTSAHSRLHACTHACTHARTNSTCARMHAHTLTHVQTCMVHGIDPQQAPPSYCRPWPHRTH